MNSSTRTSSRTRNPLATRKRWQRNCYQAIHPFLVLLLAACSLLSLVFHAPATTLFVNGFSIQSLSSHKLDSTKACKSSNSDKETIDGDDFQSSKAAPVSRRDLFGAGVVGIVGGSTWLSHMENALALDGKGPVAVIGASGRTGALCVTACLRRGIPVKALTRTGDWKAPPTPDGAVTTYTGDTSNLLTIDRCDVTSIDLDALAQLLEGCSAVIYAASASKQGGAAIQVDNQGVAKVARASLGANVPRTIVISSTSTTRPKSLGYIFTNLGVGGNIMGEKRNGELATMATFAPTTQNSAGCSYTIVRPGGLEEPKRNSVLGPLAVELSQGDVFAGVISRADVAETTVELALSNAPNLRNTAVELYYANSVVEVQGSYTKLLQAAKMENSPENKQLRLHGTTYAELFQNVRPNIDFAEY